MKWFFLAAFAAALFCSIFWTAVIIHSIATHRLATMGIRAVYVVAPLLFFIWGARETFRYFKDAKRENVTSRNIPVSLKIPGGVISL